MLAYSIIIAQVLLTVAQLLNLYRLIKGPGMTDRILALDTMYINAIAMLLLFGITFNSAAYFEAGLIIAVMGFISTVAAGRYLLRGRIVE
ncbi:K+/H+ antiporter subunit F [Chrysiogenes arsenatis]|uniref:K+/H+ antiporter subunit F n=1 Tax=Chrysiogenes arsenatis TaxID=309797 RepID=UPI000426623D|nr:K+/H+ antiporter subunit F [Chrysiogenes arsenatis]